MKWPLNQIKAALDAGAQRRDVLDLVQSGTRSVRVISEDKVVQLIEAVVHDALGESHAVDPAERDRLVAQAKSEFAKLARQQAETDMKSHRQQETILSFQRRVEDLEREKQRLLEAQKSLEQQRDEALLRAATPIEYETQPHAQPQAQAQPQTFASAPAPAPTPAAAPAPTQFEIIDRTPEGLAGLQDDMRQVQQLLARLELSGSGTARDLESRFEQSMQRVLDKVGRTVNAATSRPLDHRVEATEALIGKVLEDGSGLSSNLHDLDVSERKSDQSIQRSLERLRKARKAAPSAPPQALAPAPVPGAPPQAAPAEEHGSEHADESVADPDSRRPRPAIR